jgi:hypothetical protein
MLASYLEYSPDVLGGASLRSFIWLARLPLLDAQCGRGPHQTSARQNIVDGVFHSVRLKIASLLSQIATVYFAYYYYCFTTDATGSWLLKKKDPNWP